MPKRSTPASRSPNLTLTSAAGFPSWATPWTCGLIFILAFAIYFPSLRGGLLWDDAAHVTRAELRSLGGLFRIWFEPGATQQYYPLLHSAFWLEAQLWGDATFGYHLVNVILHATAACLAGILLRRLAVPGAWMAALLFLVHPVSVESVAWISEQKNTLSLVLYLGAALAYLRFEVSRRAAAYAVATAVFLFALLTKTVTATLPAALLVIFWWRRGRLEFRRDVRPLLPWFALSAVFAAITAHMEAAYVGAQGAEYALTGLERALLAGRVVWFYLGKLFWPADLIFIYPRWEIDAGVAWQYLFPLGALVALVALRRMGKRGVLAAALFFVGSLFPALGFINVYPFRYSYVADHFQYLPSLGIFAALGAALAIAAQHRPALVRGGSVLLFAGLAVVSWRQTRMYRDEFTLYETTIRQNPGCWLAHNNLGCAISLAGRPAEAIPYFEKTLQLNPRFAEAECNLGDNLRRVGRPLEALPHFEKAYALQPNFAETQNNWGIALIALGRREEAVPHFLEAVRLKPDFVSARFNAGLALARVGKTAEAIPHFQRAVELQPGYAEAELSLGLALAQTQRLPEAALHFEKALRLEPRSVRLRITYGNALLEARRHAEALTQFDAALNLDPNSADAHYGLALALRETGRLTEAQEHLETARRLGKR